MSSETVAKKQMVIGGLKIPYLVARNRRAFKIWIRVDDEDGLVVVLPKGRKAAVVPKVIRENREWVLGSLEKREERIRNAHPPLGTTRSLIYRGRKVDLKVAIDMESAVEDIGNNVTQLCAMGPANYVDANMKYGVHVVAKALRKGKAFHHAAIVARAGGIASVPELRGKSFAFGSLGSSTRHILPLAALKDSGVSLADLSGYRFLGHHEKVAKSVLSGEFDAGAIMEEEAQRYRDAGLVIIGMSAEIPEFNVCVNSTVDDKTVTSLREALVSLDSVKDAEAGILRSLGKDCSGFAPATDEEYSVFREKILSVEAELKG